MLHEILMGLLGYSGNIINIEKDEIKINKVSFISELEEQLLSEIMQLGLDYKKILEYQSWF